MSIKSNDQASFKVSIITTVLILFIVLDMYGSIFYRYYMHRSKCYRSKIVYCMKYVRIKLLRSNTVYCIKCVFIKYLSNEINMLKLIR